MSDTLRFNMRVDQDLLKRVKEEAAKLGISTSDFFRMAVVGLLEKNEAHRNGRITIHAPRMNGLLMEEGVK